MADEKKPRSSLYAHHPRGKSKRSERAIRLALRRQKALDLKLEGKNNTTIATQLGVSLRSLARDIDAAMAQACPPQTAERVCAISVERIERVLAGGLYAKAVEGDLPSIREFARLTDLETRITGVQRASFQPMTVNVNGKDDANRVIKFVQADGTYVSIDEMAEPKPHMAEATKAGPTIEHEPVVDTRPRLLEAYALEDQKLREAIARRTLADKQPPEADDGILRNPDGTPKPETAYEDYWKEKRPKAKVLGRPYRGPLEWGKGRKKEPGGWMR